MTLQSGHRVVSVEASKPQDSEDLEILLRRHLTGIGEPFATARITSDSRFVEIRFSSGIQLTAPRPLTAEALIELTERLNPAGCHMICLGWTMSGCKRIWIGDPESIPPHDIDILVIPGNEIGRLDPRLADQSPLFRDILRHIGVSAAKTSSSPLTGIFKRLMRLK
ncbi:MAG: hypothetical protein CL771_06340 [Chloroflexi bacterium]|nr:hypothetical protein [Chloroflexota bacterium]